MSELADAIQSVMDGNPSLSVNLLKAERQFLRYHLRPRLRLVCEPRRQNASQGSRLGWLWVLLASLAVGLGSWFATELMLPPHAEGLDAGTPELPSMRG